MDIQSIVSAIASDGLIMFPVIGSLHFIVYGIKRGNIKVISYGIVLFALIFFVVSPFFRVLPGLATDSYFEAVDFEISEVLFYIKTFSFYIESNMLVLWGLIGIEYGALFILLIGLKDKLKVKVSSNLLSIIFSLALIVPSLSIAAYNAFIGYSAGVNYISAVRRNFTDTSGSLKVASTKLNPLDVVVYIGESTSRLNWSLYGYPRKTTASLDAIKNRNGMISFDKINSPHSHTSQSLLEVLSVDTTSPKLINLPTPIGMQKRVSIIDVLKLGGVETSLFSNQGRSGTWNMASSIIFKNADYRFFSTKRDLGNFDDQDADKPFDHELLPYLFSAIRFAGEKNKRVYFFHSYAGHGDYLANIPIGYRAPVDDFYSKHSDVAAFGDLGMGGLRDGVEGYDSAMRYISDNLYSTIKEIDALGRPVVAIYFSDHGESPLTGLGHDSSRYIWEMSAIPFVLYFNEAARLVYNDKYVKYKNLASLKISDSIVNFNELLFDLLDVSVFNADLVRVSGYCIFGSGGCYPDYHMSRELQDGNISYVRLSSMEKDYGNNFVDSTDRVTSHSMLIDRFMNDDGFDICFHRSNTISSIIRAKAISECIEMDIMIDDGEVFVYHPPAINAGLTLSDALNVIGSDEKIVWLDSKNIEKNERCMILAGFISQLRADGLRFFVEFPSESVLNLTNLNPCLKKLRSLGVYISYYISTDLMARCKSELNISMSHSRSCLKLSGQIGKIASNKYFTDISYDYRVSDTLSHVVTGGAKRLKHSIWHIGDNDILNLPRNKYRLVLPYKSGLNTH